MPKPISNIATMQKRKIDPTGPTHDDSKQKLGNLYEQTHFYLSNPDEWFNTSAYVVRRHDEQVNHPNFLGSKELGICMRTTAGWRVYLGIVILLQEAIRNGEDPKHHDYPTVDAMLDDGWEVD